MSEKPSEVVQSVRGLLIAIAAIVLGVLVRGDIGAGLGLIGALALLYFALATTWALIASRRRR